MTITLEDVTLITYLPIDKQAVIKPGSIDEITSVIGLLGVVPFKKENELDGNRVKCTLLERLLKPTPPPHATME